MFELTLIFKIAGIGFLIAILNNLLEATGHKSISQFVVLSGVVIALGMVMGEVQRLFESVSTMFGF